MMDREQLKELREMLTNGDHPTKVHRAQLLTLVNAALVKPIEDEENLTEAKISYSLARVKEGENMSSTNSLRDTLKKTRDMINRLNIYGARKNGKWLMIDELSEIVWQIDVEIAKLESLRQYQDEGCQCDQCAGTRKMSETDKQILKGRNSL